MVGGVDRCEEPAHVRRSSKRPLFVAQTVNREIPCSGNMAGTTSRLKTT